MPKPDLEPLDMFFTHGDIVLPDKTVTGRVVEVVGGKIASIRRSGEMTTLMGGVLVDLDGGYLVPGYVDLHVHGGDGADFMDGTEEAFRTVLRAHARHGTTSLLATSTVAQPEQILTFLEVCRRFKALPDQDKGPGARVLGAHLYGPYFAPDARGCHPGAPLRPPTPSDYDKYLAFSDAIVTATVAPELSGAEGFVRACRAKGVRCNVGHSHATYDQVKQAIEWGVTHVDHLFCAMSDRARLRQSQTFPMRGGVLEATLYHDQLTTEVIADGKHLAPELLLLAYKCKGPDRLALVTDCNRALDQPDGDYMFGPLQGGEPIRRAHGVGLMPDGLALASGVVGMDECVRTIHRENGLPLHEVIRMATLTPARIAGQDKEIGSITPGKRADLLVLDKALNVRQVYIGGRRWL